MGIQIALLFSIKIKYLLHGRKLTAPCKEEQKKYVLFSTINYLNMLTMLIKKVYADHLLKDDNFLMIGQKTKDIGLKSN